MCFLLATCIICTSGASTSSKGWSKAYFNLHLICEMGIKDVSVPVLCKCTYTDLHFKTEYSDEFLNKNQYFTLSEGPLCFAFCDLQ